MKSSIIYKKDTGEIINQYVDDGDGQSIADLLSANNFDDTHDGVSFTIEDGYEFSDYTFVTETKKVVRANKSAGEIENIKAQNIIDSGEQSLNIMLDVINAMRIELSLEPYTEQQLLVSAKKFIR